ncbi:MAG: hypothetical protein J6T51_01415 [Kiritimatiellae bacterium]|nr:hypothetical protein [Kiritimatiellia bacterium]
MRCKPRFKLRTLPAAVAAAALLLALGPCISRARYREKLIAAGFPPAYAKPLAELNYRHPRWTFQPLNVSDIPWSRIVERECTPSWNLVSKTAWAPEPWTKRGAANYTPYYAENAKAYDSGAWLQASKAAIAYFMDPRNFLNEADVFMFETLGFDERSQTLEIVERTLARTFMSRACYDGGRRTFSELLIDVGRKLDVNPVFLAGRLASEQGAGTVQAQGKIGDSLVALHSNKADRVGGAMVWGSVYTRNAPATAAVVEKGAAYYNGYYNFFNIGACGLGLFEIRYNAWKEASKAGARYCGPWKTQAKAIEGGARLIRERYVASCRHTRYLQKFSVAREAGEFRWKQYMQNIAAPLTEARNVSGAYKAAGHINAPFRFVIPVYAGLPLEPSPDPAGGRSFYSPAR